MQPPGLTAASRPRPSLIPGIDLLRSYERRWLAKDVVAGLILTALLVPQGMAYAELAGLPAITGLYTSVMCLVAYAVFGPSRVLVLGPDSSLGPMIAATIAPLLLADGDPARAVALASMLALLVGAVMILAGLAKLGFVADLLSKPTQIGYMNGLALTILIGQLPKLFGFSIDADGLIDEAGAFIRGVADGAVVAPAAWIGLGSLALILVLQSRLPKIPAVLVAVVLSIAAVDVLDLADQGVSVVGTLPQGFPPFTIPNVSFSDTMQLLPGALGIALVALVDTISTASAFAGRSGRRVDGNQEMIGIGAANVSAGLFQGFAVSTSGSRTAVAEQAGAKTQVAGLVGAVSITLILLLVPGLLRNLPQPTLAAIVIAASLSLADIRGTIRLRRQRRTEFLLSIAAFLGVALLGVLPGIAVAVGPVDPERVPAGVEALPGHPRASGRRARDARHHVLSAGGDARRTRRPQVRCPADLRERETFREQIQEIAEGSPQLRWIVIASEPITDVDTTAADMLVALDAELSGRGISLRFAELKDPVRNKIERYGLSDELDPSHFYPTVKAAVRAFQAETGAAWPGADGEDG